MRNKLFILALGGALAFGVSALAQDAAQPQTQSPDQGQPGTTPGSGPMRMDPNRQLEHMTHALSLSTDQQSQIRPLLVERQQKMEALFQDQSVSRQDRRARMQSIRQDSETKIGAVLNDQQKQKFATMQQERGRGHGGRGGMQEGAPQPQ